MATSNSKWADFTISGYAGGAISVPGLTPGSVIVSASITSMIADGIRGTQMNTNSEDNPWVIVNELPGAGTTPSRTSLRSGRISNGSGQALDGSAVPASGIGKIDIAGDAAKVYSDMPVDVIVLVLTEEP